MPGKAMENTTSVQLEAAKERLRTALTRLENVVERKLKDAREETAEAAQAAPVDSTAQSELQQRLEQAANENSHLRAENEKLSGLHASITKRVDRLIEEVRQVVEK